MELKVGDKLYARKSGGNHTEGRTYEVIEIEHDDFVYIHITGDREDARIREEIMPRFFGRVSEVPQVTKVKLTQEQARALESAKKIHGNHRPDAVVDIVISQHCRDERWGEGYESLNDLTTADLARALLIGYEVEQTAEEKVLVAYEAAERMLNAESRKDEKSYESGFWWGKINGMKSVLDAYGIKVKGINDND